MLKIYKYTRIHTQFAHLYPDLRHRHAGFAQNSIPGRVESKKAIRSDGNQVIPYGNELGLNKQQFFVEFLCAISVLKTRGETEGAAIH